MPGKGEGGSQEAERTQKRTLFKGGVLSAFGERDYAFLWSGALISNIGTWVQTAALLWFIKNVLHSNSWVGAVNMANFLPVLFIVPFAGSLADRHDRRRVIIVGQTVMMIGAFALGIAATLNLDNKAVIMVTVSIIGIAFAFNFPAWQAILPDLVRREDLLNAIALSSAQWNLARFIGPFIGAALLVYFSAATAFYANAVSFLFVIGALLLIHPKRGAIASRDETLRHDVLEGWKYVWRRKWMVNLLLALAAISFFGFSYLVLIPALVQDVLHRGAGPYGLVLGMTGLGAVVGAPLVTWLSRFVKERNIIKISTMTLGVFLVLFAISRNLLVMCLVSFVLGLAFLMIGSATNSVLQGRSVREMRGRVISFYIMTFIGVSAVGGQFMGYLSDVRSTTFSLIVGGLAVIATALVLMAFPSLIKGAVYQGAEQSFEPQL
ncbi:MAG TPA: MFS transporter [Candidatus Anoxymicrobiaceae bacterium]